MAASQLGDATRAAAALVPGLSGRVNRPRQSPLRSSSVRMLRWLKAPYGTNAKPASLQDIPWDYVRDNADDIPFLGLREYWYPACLSKELRHNDARPVTLVGDNLVLFRDADGLPRALENRCPHRSAMLSLGQVGAFAPGTLTCRYHGMTFDGSGTCVAYVGDGPDSPAIGKIRARGYPTEEVAGIVWVWMGDNPTPRPLFEHQPKAREVLTQRSLLVQRAQLDYSHLNMVDNATDLTHVGCLHRTCLLFGDQAPDGQVQVTRKDDGGLHAFYRTPGTHAGSWSLDSIDWYLPNLVYHAPGDLGGGLGETMFWFVPRDVGSFTAWLMAGELHPLAGPLGALKSGALRFGTGALVSRRLTPLTLASCLMAGDAPMQASQGRVVRWDQERLTRGDRSVSAARRILQDAHRAEVAGRREREVGSGRRTGRIARRP